MQCCCCEFDLLPMGKLLKSKKKKLNRLETKNEEKILQFIDHYKKKAASSGGREPKTFESGNKHDKVQTFSHFNTLITSF